jgi:hypothetical protein
MYANAPQELKHYEIPASFPLLKILSRFFESRNFYKYIFKPDRSWYYVVLL